MVQETVFLLGFSSLANPGAYLSCYFTTYLLANTLKVLQITITRDYMGTYKVLQLI
jgi:hypothetical protein